MKIAWDQFNPYAHALEEAQGDIRVLIKRAFLTGMPQETVNNQLRKIIDAATKGIEIERLKADARISLLNFANKQRALWQSIGISPNLVLLLGAILARKKQSLPSLDYGLAQYKPQKVGVPLQQYYRNVWEEHVKPVLDRLTRDNALDPNDFTGRNSLRNLAEMEVRYHDHNDNVDSLKNNGARLVVCSSHADCSKRCAPWQGRIYSLDGTSGTVDGHKFVPLETATDVYYTTKAGRTYKNGLLGFNCRHHLTEYKGELLPTVSADDRKKEYAITLRQREMERAVRKERAQALYNKDLDDQAYKEHNRLARKLYAQYKSYCKENNRAYYPMRVQI